MEKSRAYGIDKVSMRRCMEQEYSKLLALLGMAEGNSPQKMGRVIQKALADFMDECERPAIWCYGEHTRMLMTDYIFEMKKIRYIIDESNVENEGGFEVIHSDKIVENHIDGIVISSFKYREDITRKIREHFYGIKFLDIYQVLHEQGIDLECEYYAIDYPYAHYVNINKYKICLAEAKEIKEKVLLYKALLKEFVFIKDFLNAIFCMKEYINIENNEENQKILTGLNRLYNLELQATSEVDRKNVLMLCIDGLRRRDLFSGQLKTIKKYIDSKGYFYENAYSVSTSTYESLIPAYSKNSDLRTKYYEANEIEEAECPFITEAIRQNRNIYFYTDFCKYVKSDHIKLAERYQTASEKIWDFLLDAVDEKNGLFYVHILYESHYSYPNPYTSERLVAEGTSVFFDFLARNGGKVRTDYVRQHNDALKYLDNLLAPFLERLFCQLVLFADHGNVLLRKNEKLEDIKYPQLTFGQELIEVPLVVCSKEMEAGINNGICSIMDLNDIIIRLMRGKKMIEREYSYVKVVRSKLYNADFQYLYKKLGYSQGLEAFEAFLFKDGYKFVIYANGITELYDMKTDEKIENENLKCRLFEQIRDSVTVCG